MINIYLITKLCPWQLLKESHSLSLDSTFWEKILSPQLLRTIQA